MRGGGVDVATLVAALGAGPLHTVLSPPILYGVWHTRVGRGGGACVAQNSRNSIAVAWVMQLGGGDKGMIDSCTHQKRVKEYLV